MPYLIALLFWLVVVVGCAVGWVLNIVHLAHATTFTIGVVLEIVGIFVVPLGVVLGYVL